MKTPLACLSLVACAFASCDKSAEQTGSGSAAPEKTRTERRESSPMITEKTKPAPRETSAAIANRPIDPPLSHTLDASMIRPAGTLQDDPSWQTLTAEQKMEKFKANGIDRMPKYVSDQILADATKSGEPESQVLFITEQSAAWHHINAFRESTTGIPDHMKAALLERLSAKRGTSWIDMIPEFNEQIAASVVVDEMRAKGIPGMPPDESQDFFIMAIEKYGPDYKAILAAAKQSATK